METKMKKQSSYEYPPMAVRVEDGGYADYLDGIQCQYSIRRVADGEILAYVFCKDEAERLAAALNAPVDADRALRPAAPQPSGGADELPFAWTTKDGLEPVSDELKRANPALYAKHWTVPLFKSAHAAQGQDAQIDQTVEKAWGRFEVVMDQGVYLSRPGIHAAVHYAAFLRRLAHKQTEPTKARAIANAATMIEVLVQETRRMRQELIEAQGQEVEPAFYVNKSVIDPQTGKLRGGFSDAITWSDEPAGGWLLPVYAGHPPRTRTGTDKRKVDGHESL